MTEWCHRCLIVAAQDVDLARALCAGLAEGDAGRGMFTTPLSLTEGSTEATHYISAGLIVSEFADVLGSTELTYERAGGQVPLAAIEGMYGRAIISEYEPFSVMAANGLFMTLQEENE